MNACEILEVVSNNPRMSEESAALQGIARIHDVEGTPLDVMDRAEKLLQDGYMLVSAPLPPNIPLMRAPYRSLLLKKAPRKYDAEGLKALFKARERIAVQRSIDQSCLPGTEGDFASIDEELLLRALRDYELGRILDAELEENEMRKVERI